MEAGVHRSQAAAQAGPSSPGYTVPGSSSLGLAVPVPEKFAQPRLQDQIFPIPAGK